MIMIKTSLKKKIIGTSVSLAATLTLYSALSASVHIFPQYYSVPVIKSECTDEFAAIENTNDASPILYETSVTEPDIPDITDIPDSTEPVDTPDEIIPESNASETVSSPRISGRLLTINMSDEREDLAEFSVHSGRIAEQTFGSSGGEQFIDLAGGGQLRNCTDIEREKVQYAASVPSGVSVELFSDEPQVLIVHTHTTESYEPYEKDWFDESYTSRSYDPQNSVVAVGEAIAQKLAAAGITTVHDCTVHDGVYNGAYSRSLATAVDALSQYPSIKVVLDIHRDAIELEDGTRVSAVTEINGRKAAQCMIICAADDGTFGVPNFYENLHFACELQSEMETDFPTLTRPILFQYCQYNQQVSSGALLIEVGSHGNTVGQAVYSGELIGSSLASLLTKTAQPIEAVPVLASVPIYFIGMVR